MPDWLMPQIHEILKAIGQRLPTVAAALAVLVVGWIVSLTIRTMVFAGLKRTTLDNKLAELLGADAGSPAESRIERIIATTVYWIAMAVVFVVFFGILGVDAITHPLVAMLSGFTGAVPALAKAGAIGLIGFGVAMLARTLIVKLLDKVKFDARVGEFAPELATPTPEPTEAAPKKKGKKHEASATVSSSRMIGNVVYWVILALTAVPVVEALQIGVLARPFAAALETVTTYTPRIIAAGLILVVGFLVARLLRALTTGILSRVGIDKVMQRVGLGKALGDNSPSKIAGTIVFAVVLLHAAISALGRLQIEEISQPATLALAQVYGYMPKLFMGMVLLAIGVVLARVVGNLVSSLVAALGFNTLMGHIGIAVGASEEAKAQEDAAKQAVAGAVKAIDEERDAGNVDAMLAGRQRLRTPSDLLGLAASAVLLLLFVRQSLSTMHLEALASTLDRFVAYLPNVLVAAVVLVAGLWLGRFAGKQVDDLTAKSTDALVRALGRVAHVAVVLFASLVALQELGVGETLISLAFGLLLGAIGLALALAFGLGGRDVAGRILAKEYEKRQNKS